MTDNYVMQERKRWVFFGLPFTFTTYKLSEELLTVDSGVFKRIEDDCYMYKITDVRLIQSFGERIFKLGTVECITGDKTSPILRLEHIKNAKAVKDYILECSEQQRIKHRTINTLNIGAGAAEYAEAADSVNDI